MDYTSLSVEVLFAELQKHPSDSPVLQELTQRMRPIIMTEALKYRSQLPFDTDDYMQEGRILLWQIALQKAYLPAELFTAHQNLHTRHTAPPLHCFQHPFQ